MGNFLNERNSPATTTNAIGAYRKRLLPELNHCPATPRTIGYD